MAFSYEYHSDMDNDGAEAHSSNGQRTSSSAARTIDSHSPKNLSNPQHVNAPGHSPLASTELNHQTTGPMNRVVWEMVQKTKTVPYSSRLILCTGMSYHTCNDRSRFIELDLFPSGAEPATWDGQFTAQGKGKLEIDLLSPNGVFHRVWVPDVWYCKDWPTSVLSHAKLRAELVLCYDGWTQCLLYGYGTGNMEAYFCPEINGCANFLVSEHRPGPQTEVIKQPQLSFGKRQLGESSTSDSNMEGKVSHQEEDSGEEWVQV